MYNGRSPSNHTDGHYHSTPYAELSSYDERFNGPHNEFSYEDRSPISPHGPQSVTSPYGPRSPVGPYGPRSPIGPYDDRSPVSPYDKRLSSSSYTGRSLSSSSNGSAASLGLSGIQAHLSPPNQLPRVSEYQLKSLEANFKDNRNPSDLDITLIGAEVALPESEVKRWFEHRLARWRQQQGLPANSTSVNE